MRKTITTGEVKRRQRLGTKSGLLTPDEVGETGNQLVEQGGYYNKQEPGGKVMSKMEEQTQEMKNAEEALTSSVSKFVESAKQSEKSIKQTSGKIRDSADKLGAAIHKFMQITNSSDFSKTVEQAESLVNSLERLAFLEDSGRLDKVMAAMKQR